MKDNVMMYDSIQTTDGPKTLLRTHSDQNTFAQLVNIDSFYCLLPHKEGWIVEMIVDDVREADDWWEKQKCARVYYGKSGSIRNAK
jgi:hypothetical protein